MGPIALYRSSMIDYLFLSSNTPTPSLIDKVRQAKSAGRQPLLVYFRRTEEFIAADLPSDCDSIEYPVTFSGVGVGRLFTLVAFVWWLRNKIRSSMPQGGDCYTETFDLMLMGMVAGVGTPIRHRFEARDLHAVQFSRGPLSVAIRQAERWAIPRLHMLVLTSEKFWEEYYHRFAVRRRVVVENMPRREPWLGFRRQDEGGATFRIGFVGVIRYFDGLVALVDAVRVLRRDGHSVSVRFAGGGDKIQELKKYCGEEPGFEFTGPFRYTLDVQQLYTDLDLIYSVYDTRLLNVHYAMPNKFYEALITRIPIMVAAGTYLEERVQDAGIGIGVPATDSAKIAIALRTAIARDGWYAAANVALQREDAVERQFRQHESAIFTAVLG